MKPNPNQATDRTELEASLERLGIRELEERMEISPLLTGAGTVETTGVDPDVPTICCTCKIPPPDTLPYPKEDPGPTGPTNPDGFF